MGNWERLVWNQRDVLLAGFAVTVEVCAIAFVVAIVGGLGMIAIGAGGRLTWNNEAIGLGALPDRLRELSGAQVIAGGGAAIA